MTFTFAENDKTYKCEIPDHLCTRDAVQEKNQASRVHSLLVAHLLGKECKWLGTKIEWTEA